MRKMIRSAQGHKRTAGKAALALFAVLLLSQLMIIPGCKKDSPKEDDPPVTPQPPPCTDCLPPVTTTGQQTFGCKVNGKVWLPKAGWGTPAITLDIFNEQIGIIGRNDDLGESISVFVKPIRGPEYILFPTGKLNIAWGRYLNSSDSEQYFADTILHGFIDFLKADYKEGLFSGTFAFDLYNDKGDTIHITEGRFDIHK